MMYKTLQFNSENKTMMLPSLYRVHVFLKSPAFLVTRSKFTVFLQLSV